MAELRGKPRRPALYSLVGKSISQRGYRLGLVSFEVLAARGPCLGCLVLRCPPILTFCNFVTGLRPYPAGVKPGGL